MSYLRLVWRDVDAICHVITLGDHFHFFGTVVHDISPGLRQKNLDNTFQEMIAKVVVVGCVEGIWRNCDNVVHTAKSFPDWMRTLTALKETEKLILPSQRTCEGVDAWTFSNGEVRVQPPWTGTSPPDSVVAGDWQQAGRFLLREEYIDSFSVNIQSIWLWLENFPCIFINAISRCNFFIAAGQSRTFSTCKYFYTDCGSERGKLTQSHNVHRLNQVPWQNHQKGSIK